MQTPQLINSISRNLSFGNKSANIKGYQELKIKWKSTSEGGWLNTVWCAHGIPHSHEKAVQDDLEGSCKQLWKEKSQKHKKLKTEKECAEQNLFPFLTKLPKKPVCYRYIDTQDVSIQNYMNVDKYINRYSLRINMGHLEWSVMRNGILQSRQGGMIRVHDKSNI